MKIQTKKINKKKSTMTHLGGGIVLLCSLSLISAGFASFLTFSNDLTQIDGQINVADIDEIARFDLGDEHPDGNKIFTICQDGFINEDGAITNSGQITYYFLLNNKVASEYGIINNNNISLIFALEETTGIFINTNYFAITTSLKDGDSYYTPSVQIANKVATVALNLPINDINHNAYPISVTYTFALNSDVEFSSIYNRATSSTHYPNFKISLRCLSPNEN